MPRTRSPFKARNPSLDPRDTNSSLKLSLASKHSSSCDHNDKRVDDDGGAGIVDEGNNGCKISGEGVIAGEGG